MRVVLDPVVFVRALINPKSRHGRLLFEKANQYSLLFSKPTAQELLEVIHRPELTAKYKGLKTINVRSIIDLLAKAEAVEIGPLPPTSRDPNDDMFIATAIEGHADYLVSEDQDLLVFGGTLGFSMVNTETFIEILRQEH